MSDNAGAVHIRPMRATDLDRVLAIAATLPEAPHWNRAAYLVALDASAQPKRFALVAELEGTIAGFAVANSIGGEAELESIAVAPGAQRQGAGRQLLQALTETLRSEGIRKMLLEVRVSNLRAIAFYQELGWTECGRRPRYYVDPEEDALLLSLLLP